MNSCFHILLISVFSLQLIAQPFNPDTTNRLDADGKREGYWIVSGKNKPRAMKGCPLLSQKLEEGFYIKGQKNGLWKEYFCNGKLKSQVIFDDGRPKGQVFIYYENGNVQETGTWHANQWVGKHQLFYEDGSLQQELYHDTILSRQMNPRLSKTAPASDNPEINPPSQFYTGHTALNGQHTLYNKFKEITKEGVFKDNKLWDGKAYEYNEKGEITRVLIYRDGEHTNDEPLKK